jgi:alpha-ketoglutarate-dependent taurine dioxygenase
MNDSIEGSNTDQVISYLNAKIKRQNLFQKREDNQLKVRWVKGKNVIFENKTPMHRTATYVGIRELD